MSDKKRRPWTPEEDEILRKRIKSYGLNNWGMVADGLPGRSGKSCSERWRIYLTPGVKRPTQEPFNEYEVAVIYLGQLVHGNQWSAIAKLLPGRTNTAIKNLWKTALQSPEAKRVVSNQYIQAGHTLDSLLANPPTASEMAAAQRRKAAAAAARKRKAEAAAAAAAAAADSSGSEDEGGSSADEGEEGSASAGQEEDRAAAGDPMQVDHPAAAAGAGRVSGRRRDQQAGSPGSAGSESNMHENGTDAAAAAAAAAGGGVSSAEERGSADGSSQDPQEGVVHPGACDLLNPVYGCLADVDFGFDSPGSSSPLGSSCDQLGDGGWEVSEPSDLLLPAAEQEAAAAAAAASLSAPAAPGGDSCGEANSNSNNSGSPAEDAAAPTTATAQVQPAQVPQTVSMAATAAAAAATAAVPASAPAPAPRLGGLKPGTGLRVLLPPGSIEAVQLSKPQQQQQAQQQATQVPAAGSAAVTPAGAAGIVSVVSAQQLTPQQQQQLQTQLMLQAWQKTQAMQMQQAAARQGGESSGGSNSASSSRRAARRRPARGAAKSRPESESDNDAEIDEAAARAAAEAIASGAIKLNPNVHPAAAAAAAADAARAAARAAARKAASAAAASARKKSKAVSAPASEPFERKVARTAAANSEADEDDEQQQQQEQEQQQHEQGSGVSRLGRHRRRAAAGVAKVVAAEADEATHLGLLNAADASAQDPAAAAAATAMDVDCSQYMGMPGSAASAGAQSEYTMSYTPVYTSSSSGMPCTPHAGAAPAHSAPAAAAAGGPGDMLQHFSDDPIMMELFKHEMSVAHALQHAPTNSGGPAAATTPTAAATAAAASSAPLSPSLQHQHQQQQGRFSAGRGALSGSPVLVPVAPGGGPVVAATTSSNSGPGCGLAVAPLLRSGSSAGALPSPGATGHGMSGGMDPAEAAATPRARTVTAGASEASAATAGVVGSAGPVQQQQQLERQVSLAVPGTPAGAACSTADSEGSVFTASSRNSCTITSSRMSLAGVAVAAVPNGFVPQGQHHAGSVGYYVTFTAPNGTRQQVLVQPAPAAGAAGPSSSNGGFSGVPMQQQQMVAGQCSNLMADVAGTCSMSMPMSAPMGGMGGMPISSASCVSMSMPLSSNSAMYGQCMAAGGQQHSNPVLAAMLSNSSDMSAHNPVLHATMAALSNQGSCTCVYCLTSAGRQQGMCRPAQQQQQGCVMANCGSSGVQQAGPTPAQLASWAMPPPRPVLLPQHPLAGKQAAAAAAAITAAAAGAGVRPPAGYAAAGTSSGPAGQQGTLLSGGAGMGAQLPVSMGAAAAADKAAEAAAAAAVAAAAVGGLVGSDDDEHDWGFDVVDLDSLDVTF